MRASFLLPTPDCPKSGWPEIACWNRAAHEIKITLSVRVRITVHRANNRELIRTTRHVRHELSEHRSWNVRLRRLQDSSNFTWCIWLQVIHIDMTWTTLKPDKYAVYSLACLGCCQPFTCQLSGQGNPQRRKRPSAHKGPPRQGPISHVTSPGHCRSASDLHVEHIS